MLSQRTPPFATLQLPPIFPLYLTAISLPGLTVRYLAGWDRVVQGYTSSVQSMSLLPCFPSRLVSGLPVIVLKPLLSFSISRGAYSPSLCSLPFTLQRAQHSPQLLSPQGWSSRDSFMQQMWF